MVDLHPQFVEWARPRIGLEGREFSQDASDFDCASSVKRSSTTRRSGVYDFAGGGGGAARAGLASRNRSYAQIRRDVAAGGRVVRSPFGRGSCSTAMARTSPAFLVSVED